MQKDINIPVILDAVRQAGNSFLRNYKKSAIPQNMDDLFKQLEEIELNCVAILKAGLTKDFQEVTWHIGDEFDTEGQRTAHLEKEYWLCDAMDGAIQYLQHISGWTINLVLIRNGNPYFSVIFDPLANEMFWAKEGMGAFMNDTPIKPSVKNDMRMMLAVFEYGHQDKSINNLNQKIGASLTDLLESFGIVRNYGPHGLQLAYVAAGRIDMFHQEDLDTYNWMAGMLIAKEAGAEILTTEGKPWQWGSESLMVAARGTSEKFLKAKQLKHHTPDQKI